MKNKIIFAASECAPFAKVGGLADVVGSLPKALKELKADVCVVIPYYGSVKEKPKLFKKEIEVNFKGNKEFFDLYQTHLPQSEVPLFLIKNDKYFKGDVYTNESNSFDEKEFEAIRFLFFMQSVIKISSLFEIDIIHCHDWHSSLIPLLVKEGKLKNKTILTIHNIAHQGIFDSSLVNKFLKTNLKESVNSLKNGVNNADLITTVSPNYAKEILGPDFGFGLEKDLNERKNNLFGIINGIDENQFSPKNDNHIKKKYSLETLDKKEINKEDLQRKCFKEYKKDKILIGMVSRLAEQKGFDLIEKIFSDLIKKDLQIIILGKGLEKYENFFLKKQKEHPENVFVRIGFDEEFAHQIYAGSDIFLMPSFFEPCGLGQMIALNYGAVPIVRSTGGLKDSVFPADKAGGTGFLFDEYEPEKLLIEIEKAVNLFKDKNKWKQIQRNGMSQDFSWKNSANQYLKLYNSLQ